MSWESVVGRESGKCGGPRGSVVGWWGEEVGREEV